jgi:hypothetical protein
MAVTADSGAPRTRFALVGGGAAVLGLGLSFFWSYLGLDRGPTQATSATGPGPCGPASRQPGPIERLRDDARASAPKISTDPRSPRYDPFKLALLDKNPYDLHESEPRVEPWASTVEGLIVPEVDEWLKNVPGARVAAIDCRTSSCAVTGEAPMELDLELIFEMQTGSIGEYAAFKTNKTEDGKYQFTVIGLIGADKREPSQYIEWIKERRRLAQATRPQRLLSLKARREARARQQAVQKQD